MRKKKDQGDARERALLYLERNANAFLITSEGIFVSNRAARRYLSGKIEDLRERILDRVQGGKRG